MPTLEEIENQIRNQSNWSKFLAKRETKELPNILWEDESVENIVQGTYGNNNGVLVATNKRIIFVDKGLVKLTVEDFAYDKISSIQYKKGILLGNITIFSMGVKSEIRNVDKAAVQPFSEFVRARITGVSDNASLTKKSSPSSDDVVEKLERLAELKKKGILTDKEFQEQKIKILS